jgi:type I restriction enzyme M protein
MLGALAGDTIGSVLEFSRNTDPNFTLFTAQSCPTDDGLLTGAIAQALLDGQQDFRPYLLEAVRRTERSAAPTGPCWGSGFYAWASSGGREDRDSYGNGAAMRVSPVAWVAQSEAEVLALATLTAQPSHNHPEGIKGARCTALCVWVARQTRDPAAVRLAAQRFYPQLPDWDHIQKNHRYNETCQGCVPECVTLATECETFEETVRAACSIRGDADTLAAIAGAIAHALYGVPDEIRRETLARTQPHYPWLVQTLADFEARYGR